MLTALPALRIRPLRLLLAGQAVSFVGDALFPVALAFAVLDELDGTAGELGLVLAAQALPLALLILVAGVWADRLPRRRLMLVSDFGRMAVQATVAVLLLSGAAELWMLVALVAAYGVFEAFFRPAAGGLIPQVAGPEHLQQANALMGLGQNVGTVLGPTLGGLLVVTVGPGAAIGVDAVTFLVSALFLIRMGPVPAVRAAGEAVSGFWDELRGGVAEVRSRRWMWTFMPALTTYHLIALPCVLALGPVIADRELGGAGAWAVIVTSFGIGTILGGLLALRLRVVRPMLACVICFLAAACQPIIIGFAGSTAAIAGFELLAGIGVSAGFTLWETTLGREIPARALSRVTSLDWFTTAGAMPLGFAVVAGVAASLGTRETMLGASLVVLALLVLALAVGDVRRLRVRAAVPS
ncbi:MAG TPA: MFS transporter [Solirubrobacteraceae bacterium]|nr:MFS transporter [Solirubrobacteraceae bacterium]